MNQSTPAVQALSINQSINDQNTVSSANTFNDQSADNQSAPPRWRESYFNDQEVELYQPHGNRESASWRYKLIGLDRPRILRTEFTFNCDLICSNEFFNQFVELVDESYEGDVCDRFPELDWMGSMTRNAESLKSGHIAILNDASLSSSRLLINQLNLAARDQSINQSAGQSRTFDSDDATWCLVRCDPCFAFNHDTKHDYINLTFKFRCEQMRDGVPISDVFPSPISTTGEMWNRRRVLLNIHVYRNPQTQQIPYHVTDVITKRLEQFQQSFFDCCNAFMVCKHELKEPDYRYQRNQGNGNIDIFAYHTRVKNRRLAYRLISTPSEDQQSQIAHYNQPVSRASNMPPSYRNSSLNESTIPSNRPAVSSSRRDAAAAPTRADAHKWRRND